jgi:hypothetical protein
MCIKDFLMGHGHWTIGERRVMAVYIMDSMGHCQWVRGWAMTPGGRLVVVALYIAGFILWVIGNGRGAGRGSVYGILYGVMGNGREAVRSILYGII